MKKAFVTLLTIGLLATVVHADTSVFLATADTYVSSWAGDSNFGIDTNVDGPWSFPTYRIMADWTIDWGSIGGTITSATLEIYGFGNDETHNWQANRITGAWVETTVTHNTAPTYTTTDQDTTSVAILLNGWASDWYTVADDLTAIVQYWKDNPSEAYGLMYGYDSTSGGVRHYFREYPWGAGVDLNGARLTIVHEPAAAAGGTVITVM